MARIPDGASLIDNPVSIAPGFALDNVYVMAGVPSVFKAMLASVLAGLTGGQPLISATLRVDRGEGEIAGPLGILANKWTEVTFGSYPFQIDGRYGANIVIRGQDDTKVQAALQELRGIFAQ